MLVLLLLVVISSLCVFLCFPPFCANFMSFVAILPVFCGDFTSFYVNFASFFGDISHFCADFMSFVVILQFWGVI